MPNIQNVKSPFTLIAPGRSGTSVLSRVLGGHPAVDFVGETSKLILLSWSAVMSTRGVTRAVGFQSIKQHAAQMTRDSMVSLFPSDKKYWIHKPIYPIREDVYGHIETTDMYPSETPDTAPERFWQIHKTTFPEARYFTVLRHPYDIVLSSVERWGGSQRNMWERLAFIAELMTHNSAPPMYTSHYDAIVHQPKQAVEQLYDYFELEVTEEALNEIERLHVPG
ncbi:MAG: sulfotransferase, partial [Euryarchaeota archaeon]|nr:sulfotransferase [Euryarchaeota archaeon]